MNAQRHLTTQQRHVLDYMRAFFLANDQLPTSSAIARDFGYQSPNAANELVLKIARAGYLEKNDLGHWRFTRFSGALEVREAMLRAAAYIGSNNGHDATLDGAQADRIATTLRIAALQVAA